MTKDEIKKMCLIGDDIFTLDERKEKLLIAFCKCMFNKTTTYLGSENSYRLKHYAEDFLGFYISNADMKYAMYLAGFEAECTKLKNWSFRIGKRSALLNMDYNNRKCFGKALNEYMHE